MPQWYIDFQNTENNKVLILASDLTGLLLQKWSGNSDYIMFFPSREAAEAIAGPIRDGLPTIWRISVNEKVEEDYITNITEYEIQEIYEFLESE